MSIVVSDTSPIRCLSHLGLLEVLNTLYGKVIIPTAVAAELAHVQAVGRLAQPLPAWIEVRPPSDMAKVKTLRQDLDEGESEAIALAIEVRADYLLMDEWAGREIAASLGLVRIGVMGVLLQAKKARMIPAVKPLVDRLRREIKFRLSEQVYSDIMRLAGE